MVANVIGVKRPPGMELGQWWRLWHRTGHRWIEKCNMNVLVAIRNRMLSWAGHVARQDYKDISAKPLRCRGLQWWRWRQLNWKEVERDKWSGPHPQRFKISRWEDMVAGEVSKFVGNADGLSKTVQDNAGWLHFSQNRGSWKYFSKCGKSPCIHGPRCLGDPSASCMTGTIAVVAWLIERRIVRERSGEHLLPLSRHHTHGDTAMMLSWYNAGYGWLGSYGSWDGKSEVRSDVEWSRQQSGTKVLRWNVAGDFYLSLISSVGDQNPGMTDFLHVGELILRPQLTDDLNDLMSASAAHMTVTNTWINTHTELELPTVPVVWFNKVLCDGNVKTVVQKLWVVEQMDCGPAGLVQNDAEARMEAGESLWT